MSENIKLFLGPEEGLKQDKIDEIIASIKAKDPEVDIYTFYGFDLDKYVVVDTLNSQSMFSENTLVIIKHLEELKNPADFFAHLSKYAAKEVASSTLLLLSNKFQQSIPASFLKHIKKENIFNFYEMFEADKKRWINSYFNKEGMRIDSVTVTTILDTLENNTFELRAYCAQIIGFFRTKGQTVITPADIEKYLDRTKEEDGFTLFNYILKEELEQSLKCVKNIVRMKQTSELFLIINALLRQFRLFESYCHYAKKNIQTAETEAIGLGMNRKGINFKDKLLFKNARNYYTLKEVDAIIRLLVVADVELRKESNPGMYLELLVYNIIVNKGNTNNLTLDTLGF